MLVRATRKGYYGDRIRNAGTSFNYVLSKEQQKAIDDGEASLPTWMERVEVSDDTNSDTLRARHLAKLNDKVDAAKAELVQAEAAAKKADENLEKASDAKRAQAQAKAEAANEALDDATAKLSDAEDALVQAEAE